MKAGLAFAGSIDGMAAAAFRRRAEVPTFFPPGLDGLGRLDVFAEQVVPLAAAA